MTYYGKIKSYDSDRGAGTIDPEDGGSALSFRKADLQQQGQAPKADQRYGFETTEANGGGKRAINLRQQGDSQSQLEQARSQQG